jgi:hypothetical protein
MALNYHRSGETKTAILTLSAGIAVVALDMFAAFHLPLVFASLPALAALIATLYFALKIHRPFLERQVSGGAQRASIWSGIGVGLAMCALFNLVSFIIFGGFPALGRFTTLAVGAKDDVYYSQDFTEKGAKALAEILKSDGFFEDRGSDVFLSKDKEGPILSFVVKEGIWDNAETVSAFEQLARDAAPCIGGPPLKLRLQNKYAVIKKEVTVR